MTRDRAVAVLRIFFGLLFLTNGLAKFDYRLAHLTGQYTLITSDGARNILMDYVKHHPVQAYHDLVFNVLVPHWNVVGPLVGVAESTAGILLLLGLASRLGALIGAVLILHLQFADANPSWVFDFAQEWVPLLCLMFMRAGTTWGLDARLAARDPRWSRWLA